MRARPVDAAEGYRLFQQQRGLIELAEINEYLRGLGMREVSPRMYVHYQRLYRHGYHSYIPINRLDIALAGEDAWSDELQARYPEIDQAVPGIVIHNVRADSARILSLGVATATVHTDSPPGAGSPVVLRLVATGIERSGTVIRSDPASGRFHVAFDPYGSLPLAPLDAPQAALFRLALPTDAESLVAVGDFVLSLDRFLVRAYPDTNHLLRVRTITFASPLEVVLLGGVMLVYAIELFGRVALHRKHWYEGTKAKYEAKGLRVDTPSLHTTIQHEADAALKGAFTKEVTADESPLLDSIATPLLPQGPPDSDERRRLADAAIAATDLPVDLDASTDAPDAQTNEVGSEA